MGIIAVLATVMISSSVVQILCSSYPTPHCFAYFVYAMHIEILLYLEYLEMH